MEDWAKITDNTKELLKSKNFATAKLEINNLLKKYPNEIKLLNIAADIYRESGDHVRAIEHAELLTILEPDNWVNYLNMSDSWIQLGQIYKAKIAVDNAIKKNTDSFLLLKKQLQLSKLFSSVEEIGEISNHMKTHFPDKREGYEESIKFKLSTEINKCFINTILSEYSGKCSQKSKLINGLKHWDKNSFKKLWLSSFFHDSAKKVSKYIFTHQPFQYWSQGTIPSDLLKLQRMWNSELDKIGIRPIKTFDKLSAHQWIKNNVPELQIAFETAPHYAVESDVFRVAYASQNDCIYLDIDSYVLPKSIDILAQKITSAKTTLLFAPSRPYILSGVFATSKNSQFFVSMVKDLSDYTFQNKKISQRLIEDSFGPRRFSSTLHKLMRFHKCSIPEELNTSDPSVFSLGNHSINFINSYNFCLNTPPWILNYKKSVCSWQYFVRQHGGVIRC